MRRAETWLYDTQAKQGDMALSLDPVITIQSINKARNDLFAVCNPVMTKPKPTPAPAPAPAAAESKSAAGGDSGSSSSNDNAGMDEDKHATDNNNTSNNAEEAKNGPPEEGKGDDSKMQV
jgi:hypothetical protein